MSAPDRSVHFHNFRLIRNAARGKSADERKAYFFNMRHGPITMMIMQIMAQAGMLEDRQA